MQRNIAQAIAGALQARLNCEKTRNQEWFARHGERIESLVKEHFPSGSGFDSGTEFDMDDSKPDRLVFFASFHHMNQHGFYECWTQHAVIVRPSLVHNFDLKVTGRDRNGIKDYIAECFHAILSAPEPVAIAEPQKRSQDHE